MISKQHALWLGIGAVGFTICVTVLDALAAPTLLVFLSGMAFHMASDPVMEWFIEWEEAEETRAEYSEVADR